MKKRLFIFILLLTLCLLITGCNDNSNDVIDNENEIGNISEGNSLLNPEMEWWELFNPNGFDTVAALINNPNDIPIDVTYDLVYYKEGKEVARSEMYSNYSILPKGKSIIWGNEGIPKSEDVDDIKMENVIVTESLVTPIDGTIELDGIGTECELYFLPMFDQEPSYLSAWFVFYNDENGNDRFDKGEISYVDNGSVNTEDRWICIDPIGGYTDYDIYFTAY